MAYEIEIPFEWPTEWAEWIATLDTWLSQTQLPVPISSSTINDIDSLVNWALDNGFAVVRDEAGNIVQFISMTTVDPANSSEAISIPIEDITESVGTAGTVASYTFAGGATGMLKRAAVVGIVLSLLTCTIGAALVTDEIQEELEDAVTPYTKDGEHVFVYYGKHNGAWKTYLPEDVITAVRDKAVELGIFDTTPIIEAQYTYTGANGVTGYFKLSPYRTFTAQEMYDELSLISDGSVISKVLTNFSSQVSTTRVYQGYVYGQINTGSYEFRRYVCFLTYTADTSTRKYFHCLFKRPDGSVSLGYYYYDPRYYTEAQIIENFKTAIDNYDISSTAGPTITGAGNENVYIYSLDGNSWSEDVATSYRSSGLYSRTQNISRPIVYPIEATTHTSLNSNPICFGFNTNGAGVEGITPSSTAASDMAKTLADLLPDAWNNKVSLASPTDSNIFNKKNYLPASVETVDPFTDGTTQDSTEAQTGDIPETVHEPLIEYINELITQLINDPDNPIPPTYPAGDSGDTPPANPSLLNGSANGLWKIYNPLLADIQAFGSWLWSSSIIDQITRMFASPIDAVIALHQIYCTPVRGASANIKCGYLDSGVQSTYTVANQYQTIDCGDVTITEYYGTAVDYSKTKISIYLPFIGIVPLDPSVVMGSVVNVTYRIDVLTGTCIAQVKVNKQNSNAVMYTFPGNCACQIPLTGTTYTGMVSTLIGLGNTAISVAMDNPFGVISGAKQALQGAAEGAGTGGVRQSGYFGSNAGALGIRIPYVIITHPVSYDAYLYNSQYGFPSNKTVSLGSVRGFTKVKDIHLSGIPCTDDELEEIERLLKEGVIIN